MTTCLWRVDQQVKEARTESLLSKQSNQICVTGCPRSSTKYMADLLGQITGEITFHEPYYYNPNFKAISDWMLTGMFIKDNNLIYYTKNIED